MSIEPFRLPGGHGTQGAVQLFHVYDIDRANEDIAKKGTANYKVHQKTTCNSRIKAAARYVALVQQDMVAKANTAVEPLRVADFPSQSPVVTAAQDDSAYARRDGAFMTEPAEDKITKVSALDFRTKREVVNMREFVRKKRDIFLVQMSLDVTKEEVVKLEDSVRKREEALSKSEAMVDADTQRFEVFLNTNDKRARSARKNAEAISKKKVDKQGRIKLLKSNIDQLESEIANLHEQQLVSSRYADFLNRLTPQEWKDEQKQMQDRFLDDIMRDYIKCEQEKFHNEVAEPEYQRLVREFEADMESMRGRMTRKSYEEAYKSRLELVEACKIAFTKKCPSAESLTMEWIANKKPDIELPEPELYFKEPHQLMDILQNREEKNLFYIQETQSIEESIDDVITQSRRTREHMEKINSAVREQASNLEGIMNAERRKIRDYTAQFRKESGTQAQDKKIEDLKVKIKSAYVLCGFDIDHDPDSVVMLASIENKLEELMTFIEGVESTHGSLIIQLERQLELDRRRRLRKERRDEEAQKQEKRLQASLKRSQAPVFKRVGKQVMFRSAPLTCRKEVVMDNTEEIQNEDQRKLFGFYLNKDGTPQTLAPEKQKDSASEISI